MCLQSHVYVKCMYSVNGGQRLVSGVCLSCLLSILFWDRVSLNLELTGLADQQAPGTCLSPYTSAQDYDVFCRVWIFCIWMFAVVNSGPLAHTGSTLLTESSPQLRNYISMATVSLVGCVLRT